LGVISIFEVVLVAKKLVMVVDDEPDIRETVKKVLEMNDFAVVLAKSADDCLEKLKKKKPDLILMDIMMPGTPVKDVLKKIKGVKVVFISVVRTSEAEKEDLLKSSTVVDFIQKPFDINELIYKVKELTK